MNTDLSPNPASVTKKWRRFENVMNLNSDIQNHTFLYIGSDKEFTQIFSKLFRGGIVADSYSHSQHVFNDIPRFEFPDVIFIDLQLNKENLRKFYAFLKSKRIDSRVVIIYNEDKLTPENILFLKQNELVDDVFNLNASSELLSRKIAFLKKVKDAQPGIKISAVKRMSDLVSVKRQSLCLKRVIDIAFSASLLLLLFPLFILVAIAIKLDSKGPVIYSSLRAGRGFKIFKFYKFRTMVVDADKKIEEFAHLNQYGDEEQGNAKFLKFANDPRITRLGRILRNTSIDELPQLFNVLIGDMSLVGNRPLPLYEASTLTTNEHVERFMAPAGITGLWQIKKRGKAEMSVEERISLDIYYARKYNVVYDLWIVAYTPAALFQKSNA